MTSYGFICKQQASFPLIWMLKWELVSRTSKTWVSGSRGTLFRCELNKCLKISDLNSDSSTMPRFLEFPLNIVHRIAVSVKLLISGTSDTRTRLIQRCKMVWRWTASNMLQTIDRQRSREVKIPWRFKRRTMQICQRTTTDKARYMTRLRHQASQQKCKSIQLRR